MQPMWICLISGRRFEEAFWKYKVVWWIAEKNAACVTLSSLIQALWVKIWKCTVGKAKQIQPVSLCLLWSKRINDTEKTQYQADNLRMHLKTHIGEKSENGIIHLHSIALHEVKRIFRIFCDRNSMQFKQLFVSLRLKLQSCKVKRVKPKTSRKESCPYWRSQPNLLIATQDCITSWGQK